MESLVFFTFAAFGLAYIVGHARISLPIRQWIFPSRDGEGRVEVLLNQLRIMFVELIECPACFGFWIGFIGSVAVKNSFIASLCWGCYISGVNFLLGKLTSLIKDE